MALSVSTKQTVLWDQVQYDGNPSEFAWVLPVKKGAYIEVSTDAWFEALDAATAVHVTSPPLDCPPPPGASGAGCGASEDLGGISALSENSIGEDGNHSNPADSVTVVHRGTVGPYETVTLATDVAGALNAWLTMHEYAVGADIQPVIDAYVAEDFDFIALRLKPDAGVREMKPVRVVTPGAGVTLPLRMVAAGTGASVGITLFVITEGRFATTNFPSAEISAADISWDHLTQKSNYAELRKATLGKESGRTWLSAYAKQGALLEPLPNPTSFGNVFYNVDQGTSSTIAEAYLKQAMSNKETLVPACPAAPTQFAKSNLPVVDTCPPDTMDPATCPAAPADTLDARDFACGAADDLATALTGLHPRDVWLTRLDAFLPRAALATDLELGPAASQSPVENWIRPGQVENVAETCRQAIDQAAVPMFMLGGGRGGESKRGAVFGLISFGIALLWMARRATRPSPSPSWAR